MRFHCIDLAWDGILAGLMNREVNTGGKIESVYFYYFSKAF
jgi:hypothetical protein